MGLTAKLLKSRAAYLVWILLDTESSCLVCSEVSGAGGVGVSRPRVQGECWCRLGILPSVGFGCPPQKLKCPAFVCCIALSLQAETPGCQAPTPQTKAPWETPRSLESLPANLIAENQAEPESCKATSNHLDRVQVPPSFLHNYVLLYSSPQASNFSGNSNREPSNASFPAESFLGLPACSSEKCRLQNRFPVKDPEAPFL